MDISERSHTGLSHRGGEASRRASARSHSRKPRNHLLPEKLSDNENESQIPRASIRSTGIHSLLTMDSALETSGHSMHLGDDDETNFSVDEEETNLREVPHKVILSSNTTSGNKTHVPGSFDHILNDCSTTAKRPKSSNLIILGLACMMFVGTVWVYNPTNTNAYSSLLKGGRGEGWDEQDEPVLDFEQIHNDHNHNEPEDRLLENPSTTTLTCPETYCATQVATQLATVSGNCAKEMVQLDVLSYDGDDWIELWGPQDSSDAAALILVAGHGGSLKPSSIPARSGPGISTSKDSYTLEIAEETADAVIDNYCQIPYLVKNNLHRSRMDANREIEEAAMNNDLAEEAWWAFHNFIQYAQLNITEIFGNVTNLQGTTGVPGLLVDFHGYTGYGWDSAGSPHIQWGYRYGSTSLNSLCPLDNHQYSTAGSMSFGSGMLGHSNECLVRGPLSLGERLNDQLPISSWAPNEDVCGTGLPSLSLPDPVDAANDDTICTNDAGSYDCSYYSGGYITQKHEHVNWNDDLPSIPEMDGVLMNTVQAEFPRCLRFASGSNSRRKVHPALADKLSKAMCSFVHDLFPTLQLCG